MELDAEFRCIPISSIVLQQTPAHVAGSYSNDCVFAGIVSRRSSKQLYADNAFFEALKVASYCLVNDILKELNAAVASLKCFALNYFLNVFPERRSIFLVCYDSRQLCFANTAGIGRYIRPQEKAIFSPFHRLNGADCGRHRVDSTINICFVNALSGMTELKLPYRTDVSTVGMPLSGNM